MPGAATEDDWLAVNGAVPDFGVILDNGLFPCLKYPHVGRELYLQKFV
jgi:hypothetical protein